MSGTPRHDRADTLRGRPDAWSGLVWLLAVTAVCGIADYFALPDADVWFGMPLAGHEMFRPEWLVVGTLAAYPLVRLGRASLVLGVLGLLLCSGQMFTIVDNARERYVHNAGAFGGGPDFPRVYYAVAAVQVVIFLIATGAGLRRRWADIRWTRMMRRMAVADSQPPAGSTSNRLDQVAD